MDMTLSTNRYTSFRELRKSEVPLPPVEGKWEDDGETLVMTVGYEQWRVRKGDYSLVGYYRYGRTYFGDPSWVEGWIADRDDLSF